MQILIYAVIFTLGAILASFITVIAERVYTGHSWVSDRSRCGSCREALRAHDLVPIFSWLVSGGRCRYCGVWLGAAYVLGEVVLGGIFALAVHTLGLGVPLLVFLFAACILFFIVLYDLRHTVVPPASSLLLFAASLAYAVLVTPGREALGVTLLMAGGIALFLFLLFALSRGRAMGLGDAPVAFSLALLAGGELAFAGLLYSFWIGALFGIGILFARRGGPRMGIEVPFVPFMAAGFLLAFFTQWNPVPLIGF